jgi:hypothetical protein
MPSIALTSVSDAERREFFGRAVRTLSYYEGAEASDFREWRFPAARTLCYDYDAAPQRPLFLERLLQRSGPHTLTRADVCRTPRRAIWSALTIPSENTCIPCSGPWNISASGPTLMCFARQAGLLEFSCGAHIPRCAVDFCHGAVAACSVVERPFGKLQTFSATVSDRAVPGLVALLAHAPLSVLDLQLACSDRWEPFFAYIVRLATLQHLCITRSSWYRLEAEEFVQLGRLPCTLQTLRLDSTTPPERTGNRKTLTVERLDTVLSHLPQLQTLQLSFGGGFTPNALRIIGERCRRMASVAVHVRCNIAALERSSETVIFPELELLAVKFPGDGPTSTQ